MRLARSLATVSFDPNIRPFVTPDREAVARLVERQVTLASIVKASEEDLEWLYPDRPIADTLAAWAQVGSAILRRDARGTRRRRHSGQGQDGGRGAGGRGRRHGRRRRQLHVGAALGDGSRRCARGRSACSPLAANWSAGCGSRRPRRRSPARARAPIRRPAPRSRPSRRMIEIGPGTRARTTDVAGAEPSSLKRQPNISRNQRHGVERRSRLDRAGRGRCRRI